MPPEVQTAWITAITSIVVAYFSYLGIKAGIQRSRRKRSQKADEVEQDEALVRYEDNPAQFVKDLFADNQVLRDEVRKLDEERRQDRADVDAALRELRALRIELDAFKREDVRFRDALGRWLARIFTAWGVTETMPWPGDDDALILKSVLPTRPI